MTPLFGNLCFVAAQLLRIPFDIARGIRRRFYVLSSAVAAPKDVSWAVASAHKIKMERTEIELDTEPDPERPGVYSGVCRYGDKALEYAYQILEEKPGEFFTFRILTDESDPIYRFGEDLVGAVAVAGDQHQSVITNSFELTHSRFSTRLLMPLTVLRGAQSLKRTAEVRAGTARSTPIEQLRNALLTGALTFASFFALFGWSTAAILLGVVVIHELGHVVALRWAGIPVRGIYFVPFFGGVAIGDSLGASEVTRGFVALMGPALSMLTTSIFALLSLQNSEPLLADLALMSALLNGFNLLPVLPLDGGRVLQALMSRLPIRATRVVHLATLAAGGTLATMLGDYLLMAVIALMAPAILASGQSTTFKSAPLSRGETAWLASGYLATLTFYVFLTLRLWNETPLPAG